MLSIKIRTTPPDLPKKISEAPKGARGKMTEDAAWFLVGKNPPNARGLRHYPPKPPGSTYRRTYILREGWGFYKYGTGIQVTNTAYDKKGRYYPPYVVGDKDQAWMHKGRWRTVSKVIADNLKGMIQAAEHALQVYLKSKGL